jgi:Endonuclease NucS C-terminal domain
MSEEQTDALPLAEEQTKTLPIKAAYVFGEEKGLGPEIGEITDLQIEWDKPYTSSLRRGYIVALLEKHGLFEEFKTRYWSLGNTPEGQRLRRRFLRIREQHEDWLKDSDDTTDEEEETDRAFAAETDLRDFLAKNLNCIEAGLTLYTTAGQSGVEFPVDGGRIDILAVDQSGRYIVIELKVGRGRNKAVGQLLYYMGWVDKNLGKGPCRGLIIAKDIPDTLVLTVQRAPGVTLARYKLSVSIEAVPTGTD